MSRWEKATIGFGILLALVIIGHLILWSFLKCCPERCGLKWGPKPTKNEGTELMQTERELTA